MIKIIKSMEKELEKKYKELEKLNVKIAVTEKESTRLESGLKKDILLSDICKIKTALEIFKN